MATEGSLGQDVQMYQSPPAMPTNEPRYGGFTRFEIELEFVQSLASPFYINYLASEKYFDKPAFIAYLNYLLYFTKPPYLKFLTYPGPTLRNLELLQNERFRTEILDPAVAMRFWLEGMEAAKEWPNKK